MAYCNISNCELSFTLPNVMSRNIYRALQQYLDTMSLGFPPTESGIELKILQKLFTEKDARLFYL